MCQNPAISPETGVMSLLSNEGRASAFITKTYSNIPNERGTIPNKHTNSSISDCAGMVCPVESEAGLENTCERTRRPRPENFTIDGGVVATSSNVID